MFSVSEIVKVRADALSALAYAADHVVAKEEIQFYGVLGYQDYQHHQAKHPWVFFRISDIRTNAFDGGVYYVMLAFAINSVSGLVELTCFKQNALMSAINNSQVLLATAEEITALQKNQLPTSSKPNIKEEITKLTEEMFGEERVWLAGTSMIIHFPEIDICNSAGKKHPIKDLFVKFNFLHDFSAIDSFLSGLRTTLSTVEVLKSYQHSHLNSNGLGSWCSFCLGSSTPIVKCFMELQIDKAFSQKDWKDKYYMFLFQIDQYVRWESKEGGPYRFFKDLSTGMPRPTALTSLPYISPTTLLFTAVRDVIFNRNLPHGSYLNELSVKPEWFELTTLPSGRLRIVLKPWELLPELRSSIEYYIQKNFQGNTDARTWIILYDPINKTYHEYGSTTNIGAIRQACADFKSKSFIFKGKPVPYSVPDEDAYTKTSYQSAVNPAFYGYVEDAIELMINNPI